VALAYTNSICVYLHRSSKYLETHTYSKFHWAISSISVWFTARDILFFPCVCEWLLCISIATRRILALLLEDIRMGPCLWCDDHICGLFLLFFSPIVWISSSKIICESMVSEFLGRVLGQAMVDSHLFYSFYFLIIHIRNREVQFLLHRNVYARVVNYGKDMVCIFLLNPLNFWWFWLSFRLFIVLLLPVVFFMLFLSLLVWLQIRCHWW